jgi:GNAT superfamily N-acetyltransferase
MGMEIDIKKANISEIDDILGLINGLYDLNYIPFEEDRIRSGLKKFLDDESKGHVWTVYDKDNLIGYFIVILVFSLEYNGEIAIIDEMYIKESHRNRGYGKAILGVIEDFGRERDIRMIALEIEKHNVNAQVFFQIKGFQKLDRMIMIKDIQ